MIEAINLYKYFGRFPALDGVNFKCPEGVVGLVGNNGAGKTTFLKVLLGITEATQGEVYVFGTPLSNMDNVRQQIGYMSELDTFLPDVSGKKFIAHLGQMSGLPRTEALKRAHDILSFVGLGEERHRKIETYSKGMRQKLKLASSLIHSPKLLLLDEPTDGLDPEGRTKMLNAIKKIHKEHGINVLISSHILPDIERVANFLVVLHMGKVLLFDSLDTLLKQYKNTVVVRLTNPLKNNHFSAELAEHGYPSRINRDRIEIIVDSSNPEKLDSFYEILFALTKKLEVDLESMGPHKMDLNEVFIDLFKDEEIKRGKVAGRL